MDDHGNREGIDHFVMVICWLSVDEDGNNVIRHYNLDIDKGGHTTQAAAEAIQQSLKVLQLDGLEVEISFLHGDAGGGASVQSLQPECVRIGTIPEHSDYINCVLHAIHLAYKKHWSTHLVIKAWAKTHLFNSAIWLFSCSMSSNSKADWSFLRSIIQ